MNPSRILLQVFPFTLIGFLSSLIGASIWQITETPYAITLRVLFLVLAFVGLMGFKRTPNWNVLLLIPFAFILGSFSNLGQRVDDNHTWGIALLLGTIVIIGCYVSSQRIRHGVGEISLAVWLLSWVYMIGWVAIYLLDLELLLQKVWASFGLALFGGLITFWFAQMRFDIDDKRGSVLGIDLYLLSLNVVFASRILLRGIGV